MISDVDTLNVLENHLKVSLRLLENEAPKEEGVIVQPAKLKKKNKWTNIKDKIPKAKRIKSDLTGRVSVTAEQMKLSSNLRIPRFIKEPVNQILDVAPANNAIYDTPMQETNNSHYSDKSVNTVKKEKCVAEEETEEEMSKESDDQITTTGCFEAHGPVNKRKTMLFRKMKKN